MNLHFESVNTENRKAMEALQIFPEQSGFIESVAECLSEADRIYQWKPVGIYQGTELVGFSMYGYFDSPPPGRLWLDRLLIDKKYQGKGYGKASVRFLLGKLHREYHTSQVFLSVYDTNKAAIALYEQMGFRFNGERDAKGERIMVYVFSTCYESF